MIGRTRKKPRTEALCHAYYMIESAEPETAFHLYDELSKYRKEENVCQNHR